MATKAARPPQVKDPVVIYVHGIGKHPADQEVKREWDLALFGRPMGEQTRIAYWSDILHPDKTTGPGKKTARGTRAPSPEAAAFERRLLARMGMSATSAAGGVRKKVLPRFLGPVRDFIAEQMMGVLAADARAYFYQPGIRQQVQARLREQLAAAEQPVVIVAHSLGTVVAWEVIASMPTTFRVSRLVTLGSPLGIDEVFDLLRPKPEKIPPQIQQWYNFADRFDPVALDASLASDFPAPPGVARIQDELITNMNGRSVIGLRQHSAAGYLAHPSVRNAVHRAIQFDSLGRFVVARDVAESLVHEDRIPVLIEILEPEYSALGETRNETRAAEKAELEKLRELAQSADRDPNPVELTLAARIQQAANAIRKITHHNPEAKVDELQRFVAARLTAGEIERVAERHQLLRVYAVWRSSVKRKLVHRSARALQIDAARASYGAGGNGITWAVLDTGVNAAHPHFANGRIRALYDCTQPGAPVAVPLDRAGHDPDGHGTHVAGIITGSQNWDGRTYSGMAPDARIVSYKVLGDDGSGEDAWIIKALDHIAATNANTPGGLAIHGINLSLGGPYDSTVYGCGFSPLCQELRRQWRSGVLVVTAAGNEGQTDVLIDGDEAQTLNTSMSIGDPANLEECIAVGAVHTDRPHLYGVTALSSRGPTSDGRWKPDVVAPGERIASCNTNFLSGRLYVEESGTSMAAPHVSGLLAAFLSARREFRGRPDDVKRILLAACTDLGRDRYSQGHGLPNLMKMLLSV